VETAGTEDGPAFRNLRNGRVTAERLSGGGIARMVKRRAEAAGFAPELFSGHSRCDPASLPRRPGPALLSTRSCARAGGRPARRCGATSKKATCSWTTHQRSSGC